MARGGRKTEEPDPLKDLRDKYNQLAAKYSAMVERAHQQWGYRLAVQSAVRGIYSSSTALAIALDGHITFRNAAFANLERSTRWVDVRNPGQALPLNTWALQALGRMTAGDHVRIVRLPDTLKGRTLSLRRGRQRRPPAIVIYAEDITAAEHRESELTHVRESLIHQHRLLMLGEAAAAVAHDLGSTLRAIAYRISALRHHRKSNL